MPGLAAPQSPQAPGEHVGCSHPEAGSLTCQLCPSVPGVRKGHGPAWDLREPAFRVTDISGESPCCQLEPVSTSQEQCSAPPAEGTPCKGSERAFTGGWSLLAGAWRLRGTSPSSRASRVDWPGQDSTCLAPSSLPCLLQSVSHPQSCVKAELRVVQSLLCGGTAVFMCDLIKLSLAGLPRGDLKCPVSEE